jgi:pilus assembly protein CpaF
MENDKTTAIMNSLGDVTDHVYHSLALFEQLFARLEERCLHIDESGKKHLIGSVPVSQGITPNYGVITPLLEDETVNDILINGANQIYVERKGVLEPTDIRFNSEEELAILAQEIGAYCGRTVSAMTPLIDARLPDGSRVNIAVPPVAIDGVSISIRKFSGDGISLKDMAQKGSLSPELAEFLRCAAESNINIVVAGGTGAGKTTLLNALCNHISDKERVVTIEDSAELKLPIPYVVRLESVTHVQEGRAIVTISDLVKNALRMRPNRIIVGEVRGSEAFDMIQAMNTGHNGSLTTIHANTPRDAIARIENMIGMAGLNLPAIAIRKQIASAVHLVIQAERSSDGHRRVSKVSEIVGIEGDIITMQDIFAYKEDANFNAGKATRGTHIWSGIFPRHPQLNKLLRSNGIMNKI